MLTLHVVAEKTKLLLKIAAIGFITLLLLLWLYNMGVKVKEALFPTPPPPPSVTFGKLPAIAFPKKDHPSYRYTIETIAGTLPTFASVLPVHTLVTPEPTLLSLRKASEQAATVGFAQNERQVAEWTYAWQHNTLPSKTITLDILYKTFSVADTNHIIVPIIDKKQIPSEEDAVTKAQSFASALTTFPQDIDLSKTQKVYYKANNGAYIPTEKAIERDVIEVYFLQNDVDGLPIYYENPPHSSMRFLIGENNDIINADYYYYAHKEENGTYPIKTTQEAFEELQKGNGYVARTPALSTDTIGIKNAFLAYYASKEKTSYLLPIFVFEGENGFYGYVSAIREEWIQH